MGLAPLQASRKNWPHYRPAAKTGPTTGQPQGLALL